MLAGAAADYEGSHAWATVYTWSGNGVDNLWSDATNWAGTAPTSSGNQLQFAGTNNTITQNNQVNSVGSITFLANAGYFNLNGNAVTLASSITNSSLSAQTIDVNIDLGNVALNGFAIAGADMKWARANAKIDGDHVIVYSDQVSDPTQVRYSWANNPQCNLYNSADLPAAPFRTSTDTDAAKYRTSNQEPADAIHSLCN